MRNILDLLHPTQNDEEGCIEKIIRASDDFTSVTCTFFSFRLHGNTPISNIYHEIQRSSHGFSRQQYMKTLTLTIVLRVK